MFLPRTTSTASLASLSSLRTTDSHSRPILPGSSIGWSTPTTASTTINVSAQVHYSLLASQYRLLSAQKGLGIASGSGASGSGRHRPEITNASGSSSKVDPMPRKVGLDKIFVGTKDRGPKHSAQSDSARSSVTALQHLEPSHQSVSTHPIGHTSHGPRHCSTREYAKQRLRAQEEFQEVIAAATDTGRLKWEAKAALLSASPSLALLLLMRAATLNSVSACISLSALYTTGVSRGVEPPVTLVYREPLAALAWALEAVRLLRRRREKARGLSNCGVASVCSSNNHPSRISQRQTQEREVLTQVTKVLALLERLLRTKEATADLVGRVRPTRSAEEEEENVRLPDLRDLQARGHARTKSNMPDHPIKYDSSSSPQLWPSVLEARIWLEAELSYLLDSLYPPSDSSTRDPDDETAGDMPSRMHLAKAHVACIKALALTHSTCKTGIFEEKTVSALRLTWDLVTATTLPDVLHDEVRQVTTEAASLIEQVADAQKFGGGSDALPQLGHRFWEVLDQSLPESIVPVHQPVNHQIAWTSFSPGQASQRTPQAKSDTQLLQGTQRRLSLESLVPVAMTDLRGKEGLHQPFFPKAPAAPIRSRVAQARLDNSTARPGPHVSVPTVSSLHSLRMRVASDTGGSGSSGGISVSASAIGMKLQAASSSSPCLDDLRGPSEAKGSRIGRRPSSVMSDSPSLLFGAEDEDCYKTMSQELPRPLGSLDSPVAVRRPDQHRAKAPTALATRRGKVTSLYGEPSITMQTITTSGTSSSAYGHVGSSGVFDPTASLRETQVRRRRADSMATLTTAASIRSNRAFRDVDFDEAHAPPAAGEHDDACSGKDTMTAQQKGLKMPRFPSMRSLSDSLLPASKRTEETENMNVPAPMLTERLERKLTESYAAQNRGVFSSKGNGGTAAPRLRRESSAQSIASRYSTSSRRTGLASLRAPSFYPLPSTVGQGRASSVAVSLSFLPPGRLTNGPTLATTVEYAEPTSVNAGDPGQKSVPPGQGGRELGSAGSSALSTLRALVKDDLQVLPDAESAPGPAKYHTTNSSRAFSGVDPTSTAKPNLQPRRKGTNDSGRGDGTGHATLSPACCSSIPTSRSSDGLDSALADAEDASRLKTTTGCHSCGKVCVNAPLDKKGRKYCSRSCRVELATREKRAEADNGKGEEAGEVVSVKSGTSSTATIATQVTSVVTATS